jgi:hypothetical protein
MTGRSSTPRPLDSIAGVSGILDRPPSRAMTAGVQFSNSKKHPAARIAPGVLHEPCPSRNEGAGNTGCTLHPRSRVQTAQKNAHEHTGSAEAIRHSLRNGFNAYFVLSPVSRAFLPPSPAKVALRELDASVGASGPHDFAVRLPALSSAALARVHRISPRICDDHDTPLSRGETAGDIEVIWVSGKQKYFCKWDWTGQISLIRFTKLSFRRKGKSARRAGASAMTADFSMG